ncbi:MAG TPA: hypothetical protein VE399_05000, partial [Gemmatimonadales bacterium]|nr:hypothetical protein [Gemmatimonadales bacterium]
MAGEAVAFGVAGDAALEILPRSLAVTQEERPLSIVVASVQLPPGAEAAPHVTISAELALVVAVSAGGLAGVGGSRMPGQEPCRVVPGGGIRRVRAMAVETLRLHVTPLAGARPRVGGGAVNVGEVQTMRLRSPPPDRST